MATNHEIHYVNKVPRTDVHHAIKYVGGRNPNGAVWKLALNQAVSKVLDGTYQFFVSAGGKRVWVVVAQSAAGNLYLKTQSDSLYVNNLLNLPEFPG